MLFSFCILQWKHGPLGLKLLDEFFLPSLEEKLLLLNLCPFVHFPFITPRMGVESYGWSSSPLRVNI